jgi:hypothetical protein
MKYKKFNKYEKKEIQHQVLANALHGEGMYLFRNNTKADLGLPRPTRSGIRSVGPGKEFQGDNYYMQLVKQGHLRLVKVLQTPEEERASELNEGVKMTEKLILDQPDIITEHGKIEHLVEKNIPVRQLDENGNQSQPDVLLNESPDSGFVIVNQ